MIDELSDIINKHFHETKDDNTIKSLKDNIDIVINKYNHQPKQPSVKDKSKHSNIHSDSN